jgi:hypothetical protein
MPKAAERLFDSYANKDDPDMIGAEGFERLFTEAHIPLDGAMPLLLAWQLGEEEMAQITKEKWMKGMAELQCVVIDSFDLHVLTVACPLEYAPRVSSPSRLTSCTTSSFCPSRR